MECSLVHDMILCVVVEMYCARMLHIGEAMGIFRSLYGARCDTAMNGMLCCVCSGDVEVQESEYYGEEAMWWLQHCVIFSVCR